MSLEQFMRWMLDMLEASEDYRCEPGEDPIEALQRQVNEMTVLVGVED
jgi:hypothetical protein